MSSNNIYYFAEALHGAGAGPDRMKLVMTMIVSRSRLAVMAL